jgi:lysophospholipid acyltransferase (LPLAT)-like uncharacterized protein
MKVVARIAYVIIRLLSITVRMRHVRPENIENTPQYILAFWHDQLLMPLLGRGRRWRRPITVMISSSKDGNLSFGVLSLFGVSGTRGSSTRRGAVALLGLLRQARDGKNVVFTPDGPRGPARIVKDGVIYSAQASKLPIVPIAFSARRRKYLRTWDRMMIPLPFSKCVCVYGEPMTVPRDADTEEWRLKLEQALNALSDEAERLVNER